MDVQITRSNEIFLYDAQVHGYDTNIIKAISGTPAISSNKLRLTSSEISTYSFFKNASVSFMLNIPTAPTAGDARAWGLKNMNSGNNSRVEFLISGTNFTAEVYNAAGTSIKSYPINWSSAWTATDTRFRISLTERNVYFAINDTIVAKVEDTQMPFMPLFAHIINSNADNMDLAQISAY